MLKKCLKYDFRSVFRLWWIMAVSMLGAAIVSGLGIRFFTQCAASPDVPEGLLVLSSFAMIGSIFCAHEVPPLISSILFALDSSFDNSKYLIHLEFTAYKLIQTCTSDQCLNMIDLRQQMLLPFAVQF